MSPYLRSAVAVLRRPTPQGSAFLRRTVASGGGPLPEAGCKCMGANLKKLAVNIHEMRETVAIMQEQEERFQRHEEFQKKLSYILVPSAIAFFVFGPEKKEKASSEGQP